MISDMIRYKKALISPRSSFLFFRSSGSSREALSVHKDSEHAWGHHSNNLQ